MSVFKLLVTIAVFIIAGALLALLLDGNREMNQAIEAAKKRADVD